MGVKITSDKKWKYLKSGDELPKKWRKEFDYLTNEQYGDTRFAQYRGHYYDVQEFARFEGADSGFRGWDGYSSDTYFSGIVIKLSTYGELYKIGRYYQTD